MPGPQRSSQRAGGRADALQRGDARQRRAVSARAGAAPWGMTLDMNDVTNRKIAALRTYVICRENASALGNSQTVEGGYPIQNARRQCDVNLENSIK